MRERERQRERRERQEILSTSHFNFSLVPLLSSSAMIASFPLWDTSEMAEPFSEGVSVPSSKTQRHMDVKRPKLSNQIRALRHISDVPVQFRLP